LQIIDGDISVLFRSPVNLLDVDLDKAVTLSRNTFYLDRKLIRVPKHSVLVSYRNFDNFQEYRRVGELESFFKRLNAFLKGKSFKSFD